MIKHSGKKMQRVAMSDLSGGINTDSAKTAPNELLEANNVRMTSRGALGKRGGSLIRNASDPITVTLGKGLTSLKELIVATMSNGAVSYVRHRLATATTKLYKLISTDNSLEVDSVTEIADGFALDRFPSVEVSQNKAFYADGSNVFKTDGTDMFVVGIEKPSVAPTLVSTPTTGGNMVDGTYRFKYAYAYSGEDGTYGEVCDDYLEVTLTGGTDTQSVVISCTSSDNTDIQSDKIYLFQTKDSAIYYYNIASEDSPDPHDGTLVNITATLNDNTFLENTLYEEGHSQPLSEIRYLVQSGNRMYYFDYNYGYYSKIGQPECVPIENIVRFEKNDNEIITGVSQILNYLLIFKVNKTYIFDSNYPDSTKPIIISNSIGCDSFRTIKSVENGQMVVWLSREGFCATDGSKVVVLSRDKITNDLARGRDFTKNDDNFAEYYPTDRQYVCHVPYKDDSYKVWVISTRAFTETHPAGFVSDTYPFVPTVFGLFTDEFDQKRLMTSKTSSTNGYLEELDTEDRNDDGADIRMTFAVSYQGLGFNERTKSFRAVWTEMIADGQTDASISLGVDGVGDVSVTTISHAGSCGFDQDDQGFDDEDVGLDISGEQIIPAQFRGTGITYNVKFTELSNRDVVIKGFTMLFRLKGAKSEFTGVNQ